MVRSNKIISININFLSERMYNINLVNISVFFSNKHTEKYSHRPPFGCARRQLENNSRTLSTVHRKLSQLNGKCALDIEQPRTFRSPSTKKELFSLNTEECNKKFLVYIMKR